jgi:hypothetical protein
LTTEIPRVPEIFSLHFHCQLSAITISFIDLQTREFAVLRMESLQATAGQEQIGFLVLASIDSMQFDDQALQAVHPAVFVGRALFGYPFVKVQLIMPVDVPLFSIISYASVTVQRIDVEFDSTFLSDLYFLSTAIMKPIKLSMSARMPTLKGEEGVGKLISIHWLEMSPIYANFNYHRSSGRPAILHDILHYLKYVPSVHGSMVLPGLIMTQVADCFGDIREKVVSEYKTAAFFQIIEMLGKRGRLMSTFGVTALIAQGLGIKLTSELSSELSQFLRHESRRFDNRKEVHGCFSRESLTSMSQRLKDCGLIDSNLINGLLATIDMGLKIKASGDGIFGLISKLPSPAPKVRLAKVVTRQRVPRAFLNNRIGQFDAQISEAQLFLQSLVKNEKIRMRAVIDRDIVCCTDHFVFILDQGLTRTRARIPILSLDVAEKRLGTDEWAVILTVKGSKERVRVQCENEEHAQRIRTYLQSQAQVAEMFGRSLLV